MSELADSDYEKFDADLEDNDTINWDFATCIVFVSFVARSSFKSKNFFSNSNCLRLKIYFCFNSLQNIRTK